MPGWTRSSRTLGRGAPRYGTAAWSWVCAFLEIPESFGVSELAGFSEGASAMVRFEDVSAYAVLKAVVL